MKQLLLVSAAVALALCTLSRADAQRTQPQQEVLKILGISIEGNTLADPAAIIANSGLKAGDNITVPGDQVGQAIRKLWSLKIFDDIQVDIDRRIADGVYLSIKVHELPRFEKIVYTGRHEVSEDDIMKKLNLVRGQVVPSDELVVIRREIKKLYEKDGYLLAEVTGDDRTD